MAFWCTCTKQHCSDYFKSRWLDTMAATILFALSLELYEYITENELGFEGGRWVYFALKSNTTLTDVSLKGLTACFLF